MTRRRNIKYGGRSFRVSWCTEEVNTALRRNLNGPFHHRLCTIYTTLISSSLFPKKGHSTKMIVQLTLGGSAKATVTD